MGQPKRIEKPFRSHLSKKVIKSDPSRNKKIDAFTQVSEFQKEKIRLAHAKEKKAAMTMAVIVSTFIICWLPFFVMYVLGPLVGYPSPKVRNTEISPTQF